MKLSTRTLPMLAGLALVGTAAGVSLGHSAISEINPLHYGSAPERFPLTNCFGTNHEHARMA